MSTGGIDICVWCGRSRVVTHHEWISPRSGGKMSGFVCAHCLNPEKDDGCRVCKARKNLDHAITAAANYPAEVKSEHHRVPWLTAFTPEGHERRLRVCPARRRDRCKHGWKQGIHA
jgi:hypothetical protein